MAPNPNQTQKDLDEEKLKRQHAAEQGPEGDGRGQESIGQHGQGGYGRTESGGPASRRTTPEEVDRKSNEEEVGYAREQEVGTETREGSQDSDIQPPVSDAGYLGNTTGNVESNEDEPL